MYRCNVSFQFRRGEMGMKKCFMAFALVVCLILCSFAAAESVQSGVCGVDGDHLSWTLDGNGVLTISGSGRMMDYTADGTNPAPWADLRASIQQIVLGEDVTGIGAHAFEGATNLSEVSSPSKEYALESVGSYAFNGCTSLGSFCPGTNISDQFECELVSIGDYAFQNTDIWSVNLFGVQSIGTGAFAGCGSLYYISFPLRLTEIPEKMLCNTAIRTLDAPSTLTSIGAEAFSGSEQLSTLNLNDGLRAIHRQAFSGCTALTAVTIPQSVKSIADSDHYDVDFAFYGVGENIQFTVYNGTPVKSYAATHAQQMPHVTLIQSDFVLDADDILTAYNGTDTVVTVPSFVSAIGEYAFKDKTQITEVRLPSGITSIGPRAFWHCTQLTIVNLEHVTEIDEEAFAGCISLTTIAQENPGETKNYLPLIEQLGSRAFAQCSGLTQLSLPAGVDFQNDSFESSMVVSLPYNDEAGLAKAQSFQLNVQRYCENPAYIVDEDLTLIAYASSYADNITLPAQIRAIGDEVFRGHFFHTGKSISLAAPIDFIGDYAFADTDVGFGYAYWSSVEGNVNHLSGLTRIGEGAFLGNSRITTFTIPDSVTSIGQNAFDLNEDLLSVSYGTTGYDWVRANGYNYKVVWPQGFTADNDGVLTAYSGTASDVVIPEGITEIGDQVFKNHTEIETITLPSTLRSIGESAFEGMTALTSLNIPSSVETIGSRAFALCTQLSSVTLPEGLEVIASEVFTGDTLLTSIMLPSGLREIGQSAFERTGLTQIAFPETLQTIRKNAFCNTNLAAVVIPDSVTSLGETAFYMCSHLESITFGSGAAVLPLGVAGTCNALSSVTIPEGVTTIKEFAFHGDRQVTELVLPSTLTTIVENALGLTGIQELRLPGAITSISKAFADMNALTDVYVPAGYDCTDFYTRTKLRSDARVHLPLGSNAAHTFQGVFVIADDGYDGLLARKADDGTNGFILVGTTRAFTELVLPVGITAIGDEAFLDHVSMEAVTLPDGLLTIGNRAFEGTQLSSLILPESVTSIGDAAFLDTPMISVTFAENGNLTAIGADAFRNTELSEVNLKPGLERIGNRALLECEHLTAVTLPDTITEIGDQAFQGSGITALTLPEQLLTLGAYAFEGTQITGEIVIPGAVTDIGEQAFGNTGITDVFFLGTETKIQGPVTGSASGQSALMHALPVSVTARSISYHYDSFVDADAPDWTYVWAFKNNGLHWKSSYTDAFSGAPALYQEDELLVALTYTGTSMPSMTILQGVGVLGEHLLANHNEITGIQLPSSLRIIDDYAFSHAEYLTGITLPEGVLSLGVRAFEHCKAMTSVLLPDSMNRLSDYTFDGCYQVPGIVLPDNMTYVGNSALGDVAGTRTFTVNIDSNTVRLLSSYEFFYDRQHPEYRYKWINDTEDIYDPNTGSFLYTVDRSGLELNRYLGSAAEIVIDSRVIGIGSNAFYWYNEGNEVVNTTLEKITFPEGMRYISSSAFHSARKLREVSLPGTLETISDSAFYWCPIESLTIPDAVTYIGSYAFHNSRTPEVTLKNDGVEVGYQAFSLPTLVYCGLDSNTAHRLSRSQVAFVANDLDADHALLEDCALRDISADDGTETLRLMGYFGGQDFFRLYDKIESVATDCWLNGARILAELDSHEAWVASNGDGLEYNASQFGFTTSETDEFNYVMNGEGTASIVGYYGTSHYIDAFPEFVTGIAWMPFDQTNTDYRGTDPIILAFKPESREGRILMNLDCYFRDPDDTGLVMRWKYSQNNAREAVLIKYIGSQETIVVPEGVVSMCDFAFATYDENQGNVGLAFVKSVTLPSSLKQLNWTHLYNMTGLEELTFKGHLERFTGEWIQGASALKTVHFQQGVDRIEDRAFAYCPSLSQVTGINQVVYIGEDSFSGTALTSLAFDSSPEMGNQAFVNMHALTQVTFNEHIDSIPSGCFAYCDALVSVSFEKGVDGIGEAAFDKCTSLAEVNGIGQAASIGTYAFRDAALESLTFEGSPQMGEMAFVNNAHLTDITFQRHMTSIPYNCFSSCSALTSVSFEQGVDEIGDQAFAYCTSLSSVEGIEQTARIGGGAFVSADLESLTFTGSVEIGASAFSHNYDLTDVTFQSHIASIPADCFNYAEKLVTVSFEQGVDQFGEGAFRDCRALKQVSGIEQAAVIGDYAFSNSGLTCVTLADHVEIGMYAFSGSQGLTEANFLGNVDLIGQHAFDQTGLLALLIPGSVGQMDYQAVYDLPNLQNFEIAGDVQRISSYAIYNNNALASFTVHGNTAAIDSRAVDALHLTSLTFGGGIGTIGTEGIFNAYRLKNIVMGEGTLELPSQAISLSSYEDKMDLELPASLTGIAEDAIVYGGSPFITTGLLRVHAPVDSFASHWACEKLGVFYMGDFGYAYTAENGLILRRYIGHGEVAAPYGGIVGIDNELGELSQVRFLADIGSNLVLILSDAGLNFTPSAESEWDYRYVDGHLMGAVYRGSGKEITSVPSGMEGILPGAIAADVRVVCDRNDPLAHMAAFYEPSQMEWRLRWDDTVLTLVRYEGAGKEITSLPAGVAAIDAGAFDEDVRFICGRNDPLAQIVDSFYESSVSEWKLRWNDTVLTLVHYEGSETELTSFPDGITAIDAGAFESAVSFVCDASSSMAKALGAVGYSFYTDSEHSLQMQWNEEELMLLSGANAAGDLSVPEGTTRIGGYAFNSNSNITSVTIPGSVKVIDPCAFQYCESLRRVTLQDGVEEIGDYAFANCYAISELRVPDSVTKAGCYLVSSGRLYLPDNIAECATQMGGSDVFVHADSLTARALGAGRNKSGYYEASFCDPDDSYVYAWLDSHLYLVGVREDAANKAMFRSDIYGIKDGQYYASYLKTIVLPSSLRELWSEYGGYFFGGWTQSITFPEGLTTIPVHTDTNDNLNAIVVPRSVTSIDDQAFGAGLMTVYGYAGTEAEAYANRLGIDFIDLDEDIEDNAIITPNESTTILHVGETVDLHELVTVLPALSDPYALSGSCSSQGILQIQGDQVTAAAPGTATLHVWVTDHEITEISMPVTVYSSVADFDVPGDAFLDINQGGRSFSVTHVTPAGSDPNFIWTDTTGGEYGKGESVWLSLSSRVQRTIVVTSHNGISKTFRLIGYQTLGNLTLSAETQMEIGQIATPTVKIRVDSSTRTNPSGLYTLSSSDESVIAIGDNGTIVAVGPGTATVTARHIQDMDGSKEKSVTIMVAACAELKLPSALKVIEEEAFEGILADRVIIPIGVTTISSRAFANSHVRMAVIPSSVTDIAADAFSGVTNLTIQCEAGSAAETFAEAHGFHVIH